MDSATTNTIINALTKTPAQSLQPPNDLSNDQIVGLLIHRKFFDEDVSDFCFLEQGTDGRSAIGRQAKANGLTVVSSILNDRAEMAVQALKKNDMVNKIVEKSKHNQRQKLSGFIDTVDCSSIIDLFYYNDENNITKLVDLKTVREMPIIADIPKKSIDGMWGVEMAMREKLMNVTHCSDWLWVIVSNIAPFEVRVVWTPSNSDFQEHSRGLLQEGIERWQWIKEQDSDVVETGGDKPILLEIERVYKNLSAHPDSAPSTESKEEVATGKEVVIEYIPNSGPETPPETQEAIPRQQWAVKPEEQTQPPQEAQETPPENNQDDVIDSW